MKIYITLKERKWKIINLDNTNKEKTETSFKK